MTDQLNTKLEKLQKILSEYKNQLATFEKELTDVTHEYRKAIEAKKIEQIKTSLATQS